MHSYYQQTYYLHPKISPIILIKYKLRFLIKYQNKVIQKRSHEPIYKTNRNNNAKRLRAKTFVIAKLEDRDCNFNIGKIAILKKNQTLFNILRALIIFLPTIEFRNDECIDRDTPYKLVNFSTGSFRIKLVCQRKYKFLKLFIRLLYRQMFS